MDARLRRPKLQNCHTIIIIMFGSRCLLFVLASVALLEVSFCRPQEDVMPISAVDMPKDVQAEPPMVLAAEPVPISAVPHVEALPASAAPVDAPVATPTETTTAPLPIPIVAPAEPTIEKPIAVPAEAPIAVPVEAPIAVPAEAPAVPAEAPAVPAEAPVAVPAEAPIAVPAEAPIAVPAEAPIAVPVKAVETTSLGAPDSPKISEAPPLLTALPAEPAVLTPIESQPVTKGIPMEIRRPILINVIKIKSPIALTQGPVDIPIDDPTTPAPAPESVPALPSTTGAAPEIVPILTSAPDTSDPAPTAPPAIPIDDPTTPAPVPESITEPPSVATETLPVDAPQILQNSAPAVLGTIPEVPETPAPGCESPPPPTPAECLEEISSIASEISEGC